MYLKGILRITFRNFKGNITSSVIKILGLAISIASVIMIWSYVINENKFDKGIPNSGQIFRIESHWASMPTFIGHSMNQDLTSQIVATRLCFWGDVGVQVDNNPFNIKDFAFADSTFFKVFQLEFIAGKPEDALLQPFSLVLTESMAKRLFGSIDAIGKTVRFENRFDFNVTAIIKDQPFLHFKIDLLASMIILEQIGYKGILKQYDGWSYPTYLLKPAGSTDKEYEAKITGFLKKLGYNDTFHLRPFNDIYYSPELENESNTKHGNLLYNKILIAVSIFILLLAAINFINLTIANAFARSKEVSMKKLQGASTLQLVVQFVFETVLLIFISLVLAFLLLGIFNSWLSSLAGFPILSSGLWSPKNLLIFVVGFLVFMSITAIYPSIHIGSYTINSSKAGAYGSSNHFGIRNGLILFQNLVSITLICCTLIANQQFRFMNRMDLGFDKKDVVNLKINAQLKEHVDLFKERLLKYPEISSISYSSRIPGKYWGSWCCVKLEGKEKQYFNNYVDADYLKTMGIRIKEGRDFSAENPGDAKTTYLINETAIKLYDLKNPVGQVILPGNGISGQIIGVFHDFHYRGLNYKQTPLLLFYTPEHLNYVNVKVNNHNVSGALERMKTVWGEICPAFAFDYNFLDETFNLQYKAEKRFENLLFSFSFLAIFIAGIGLFGLSIYGSERRTKEIGIRKVNGARISEVLLMLNKDFIKWVVIAYAAATPISYFSMQKWLENFAYKTELSWWIFALAGMMALGIALLTVSWQSWKAATRNPVEALRYE